MEFYLSDKVRLKGTKREWQLQRRKTVKGRDDTWVPFRFYTNLDNAVKDCAEYDFRMGSDYDDVKARIARLREALNVQYDHEAEIPENSWLSGSR